MTSQEAYKLGFLLRCAEKGMTPAEVAGHVKQADFVSALTTPVGLGLGALALGPPALGYGLGYMGAKAQESDATIDDLKKQELLAEYKRLAGRARLARQKRQMQEGG